MKARMGIPDESWRTNLTWVPSSLSLLFFAKYFTPPFSLHDLILSLPYYAQRIPLPCTSR